VTVPGVLSKGNPAQRWLEQKKLLVSQKNTRHGYGLLEGGRNSLLEFAQEATLMSVPT